MALLEEYLYKGIKLILKNWTALELALDNEWGGCQTKEKFLLLTEDISHWIKNLKIRDEQWIEDQLLAALLEDFNIQLEDQSEKEVAKNLITLYEDLKSGKTEFLKELESLYSLKKSRNFHDLDNLSQYNHKKYNNEDNNSRIDEDGFTRISKKKSK